MMVMNLVNISTVTMTMTITVTHRLYAHITGMNRSLLNPL
jgi:hypothetical protein